MLRRKKAPLREEGRQTCWGDELVRQAAQEGGDFQVLGGVGLLDRGGCFEGLGAATDRGRPRCWRSRDGRFVARAAAEQAQEAATRTTLLVGGLREQRLVARLGRVRIDDTGHRLD